MTSGMRSMQSGQGPAFFFNCPAVLLLEFWSTRNESSIALPWQGAEGGGWGDLPPTSPRSPPSVFQDHRRVSET